MFTIDPRKLPSCGSYQEALKLYENAPVVAGSIGWRGLKGKYDKSKIVLIESGTVFFRYHNTDVVEWRSKSEVRVRCWDSPSTVMFANQFLPDGVNACSVRGEMYVRNDEGYFCPTKGALIFRLRKGEWQVVPENVHRPQEDVTDLKKAAAIRKIVKPFFEWEQTMERLNALQHVVTGTIADRFRLIQAGIRAGEIKVESYREITQCLRTDSDPMRDAYILGGAIKKEPAPFGALPKKSTKHSYAWSHV